LIKQIEQGEVSRGRMGDWVILFIFHGMPTIL
jgi:hypothetical protein